MADPEQLTVLVTGFGPFQGHGVNASIEAVKLLPELLSNKEELASKIKLIIKEVPVAYHDALHAVKSQWEKHKPNIIIHVGVSRFADCLVIECQANTTGYTGPDIFFKLPNEENINPEVLKTDCQVSRLCDVINNTASETGCSAKLSCDAGRYLCEYIYFQSLSIGEPLVIFVHVPDIGVYPSLQTAQGLLKILTHLVENFIEEKCNCVK